MKFIHLADLHLGKRVNGFPMLEDQAYILKQILMIIDEEKADAVVITGDIYDKPIPPAEAVNLFDDFLVGLTKRHVQVFAISGNHDSAERISYAGRILRESGVHISPRFQGAIEPVTVRDAYGPLHIYLIPYIHPSLVRHAFSSAAGASDNSKDGSLKERSDLSPARAEADTSGSSDEISGEESASAENSRSGEPGGQSGAALTPEKIATWTDAMRYLLSRSDVDPMARNLAVAHQFVTYAGTQPELSDSEERHIGGLDNVDTSVFDAFDYVALGHLHGPQRVGRDTIRYAGSPLPYSFSEEHQKKSVTVVEIKGKGNVSFRLIPLRPKRVMKTVRGSFAELTDKAYTARLDPEDYYHVILTDEEDIPNALARLRTAFYKNLMMIDYDNARTNAESVVESEADEREKEPIEVLGELYEKQNGRPMTELQSAVAEKLIDSIWEGEA